MVAILAVYVLVELLTDSAVWIETAIRVTASNGAKYHFILEKIF